MISASTTPAATGADGGASLRAVSPPANLHNNDARLRIGLWGVFDAGDADGAVVRRVLQAELGRRLPGAEVVAYAPLGPEHPTPRDGGVPPEALGRYSKARRDALVSGLDALVIAGALPVPATPELAHAYSVAEDQLADLHLEGFFLGDAPKSPGRACRVAWSAVGLDRRIPAARLAAAAGSVAHLSVRDGSSREVLAAALGHSAAAVAAHPGLLLPRLADPATLRRRRETLGHIGVLDGSRATVLVDTAVVLGPWRDAIVQALAPLGSSGQYTALLVDLAPAPAQAHDIPNRLAQGLGVPAQALRGGCPIDDIVAVVGHSSIVISATPVLTAIALGSDVPVLGTPDAAWQDDLPGLLTLHSPADTYAALAAALRPGGLSVDRGRLIQAAEAELDSLQRYIDPAGAGAGATLTLPSIATEAARPKGTVDGRAAQLAQVRMALEYELGQRQAEAIRAEEEHRAELAALHGELDGVRHERDEWHNTATRVLTSKTWRWSEPARATVRRIRDLRTPHT